MPSTSGSTVTNQVRDSPPDCVVTRAPSTSAPVAATTSRAAARASSSPVSGTGGAVVAVSSGHVDEVTSGWLHASRITQSAPGGHGVVAAVFGRAAQSTATSSLASMHASGGMAVVTVHSGVEPSHAVEVPEPLELLELLDPPAAQATTPPASVTQSPPG